MADSLCSLVFMTDDCADYSRLVVYHLFPSINVPSKVKAMHFESMCSYMCHHWRFNSDKSLKCVHVWVGECPSPLSANSVVNFSEQYSTTDPVPLSGRNCNLSTWEQFESVPGANKTQGNWELFVAFHYRMRKRKIYRWEPLSWK